ncbi:hypothetical protein EPN52_08825 [bacterium]|nr:MAG: hypothetical protein EPN52_08825 [bacterium]
MRSRSALTDAQTAEALGAAWLERVLEPVSRAGRLAKDGLRPFAPGQESEARAAAAEVLQTAQRCGEGQARTLREILRRLPEPGATLALVAAGGTIDDAELTGLLLFLEGLRTLRERGRGLLPERLLPESLEDLYAHLARGRTRGGGFYLDDAFDPALAHVRSAAERARQDYACERARLRAAAEAVLGDAAREDGEFAIMRDTFAGPAPACVHVLREAPLYRIFELSDDAAALAALAVLEAAREQVATAEERVREALALELCGRAGALLAQARRAGEIDLHLGAAIFAQEHHAVAAEIVADRELTIVEGRLLPLEQRLAEQGRRYVPISFELRGQAVITGPNMGGKSAALRTAGFIQLCAQWGLPVPARSARLGLVSSIRWLGGAAGDERDGLLSSFGNEIVALAGALDETAPAARLLLIDEFARSTSPREGRALVVALLQALRERGELALATTHFANVAEATGVPHYAVAGVRRVLAQPGLAKPALAEALRMIGEAMDYRLVPASLAGAAGEDAIALARLLGLDGRLIAHAERELRAARSPEEERRDAWIR